MSLAYAARLELGGLKSKFQDRAHLNQQDPVSTANAASRLIQTIVWAVVVLTILVVGILILVHYKII